jgi:hypothetical protein
VAFKAGPRIDPEKAAAPRSRSSQSSVGSAMTERCGAGADASTRDRQWIDVGRRRCGADDSSMQTDVRKMSRRRIDTGKPVAGHWGAAGQRTSVDGWAHVGDGTGTMVGWLGFREDGKPV